MAGGRRRQPWYVGGTTTYDAQTTSLASLSGGYWSSLAKNDIVVVASTCYNAAQNPTISTAGYNTLANLTQGSLRLVVAYKRMGATPDTEVVVPNTDREVVVAWAFRGASATTAIDATTTTSQASSTAMDNPAITTVTPAAIVLAIGASHGTAAASPTNPAGMSAIASGVNTWNLGFDSVSVRASYIAVGQAGSYDPAAWTTTSSVAQWCAVTVALRPA